MSASVHPSDELLLAYGAGSLDEATALLVATHLALCPRCRAAVARTEDIGGALLDDLPPSAMAEGALATVLARLDQPPPRPAPPPPASADEVLPQPLRGYLAGGLDALPWQRLTAGIEQASLIKGRGANARLFRIRGGVAVPEHDHAGSELTLVLQGAFSDAGGHYRRGDVASAEAGTVHRPVTEACGTCLCLTVTDAPLRLTGLVGRLLNRFIDL